MATPKRIPHGGGGDTAPPAAGKIPGVGYEPIPGARSWAGHGHQAAPGETHPPYPVQILPKDTEWTPENLARAFGPGHAAGPTGPQGQTPHDNDIRTYLRENFRNRTAPWLPQNSPVYDTHTGRPTQWEVLYAWMTLDPRVTKVIDQAGQTPGQAPVTAAGQAEMVQRLDRIEKLLQDLLAKR